jgi:undecaprenyl-diphosphatase
MASEAPRAIVFTHAPTSSRALARMGVGALLVVAVGWVLGLMLVRGTPLPAEQDLLSALAQTRTGWSVTAMRVVSTLGDLWVVGLLSLIAIPSLRRVTRGWEASWLLALALVGSLLVTAAIKVGVGRARPLEALVTAHSAAFPSGHASRAAAVLGLAVWAVLALARRGSVRVLLGGLLVAGMVAIGLARVFLGVHWPSDVLFGTGVGVWWTFVLVHAVQPRVVPRIAVATDEPQITRP